MSFVTHAKKWLYGSRGEPITFGAHRLRYVPGTRPVRLKYVDSPDSTVRNDALQVRYFLDHVKPGRFVLDIGGHFGQYAVLFASLVGQSGRVITFEPDTGAHATLQRNLQLNGFAARVELEPVALFDEAGEHAFFSKGADSMSSLARSGLGGNATAPDVVENRVRTMRLDDYLAARALGVPDIVKVDTEGAEVNILRGASRLLRGATTVICELHPYAWKEFGTSFEDLLALVRAHGRRIEYLDPKLKIQDGAFYGAVVIR